MVELPARIVELACSAVDDPWQKVFAPEKVTVGVSKTFTVNVLGALDPNELLATQVIV